MPAVTWSCNSKTSALRRPDLPGNVCQFGCSVNELPCDTQPIAGLAHVAFDHVAHAELTTDLLYVEVFLFWIATYGLVRQRGDLWLVQLGESSWRCLRQAAADPQEADVPFAILRAAEVGKAEARQVYEVRSDRAHQVTIGARSINLPQPHMKPDAVSDGGRKIRLLPPALGDPFQAFGVFAGDEAGLAQENAFAKLKAALRRAAERSTDALWNCIGTIVDTYTPTECANYSRAAGYDPT